MLSFPSCGSSTPSRLGSSKTNEAGQCIGPFRELFFLLARHTNLVEDLLLVVRATKALLSVFAPTNFLILVRPNLQIYHFWTQKLLE
jgi:hypothetical protein